MNMRATSATIVCWALVLAACADPKQSAPMQDGAPTGESVAAPTGEVGKPGSDVFTEHMRAHARQLEQLEDALAAGDLEAAHRPAYWLARHRRLADVPGNWLPHIRKLQTAARLVTDAYDIEAARAAAEGIVESCHACHDAAGAEVELRASPGGP
ncbi:MAG: hypothetical protein KJO07_00110 [Deltaproteobacteria bacterium]|nr:hypothetical protein [Deltaproteobacteria bacterium]